MRMPTFWGTRTVQLIPRAGTGPNARDATLVIHDNTSARWRPGRTIPFHKGVNKADVVCIEAEMASRYGGGIGARRCGFLRMSAELALHRTKYSLRVRGVRVFMIIVPPLYMLATSHPPFASPFP
jgi:hypothetical protein